MILWLTMKYSKPWNIANHNGRKRNANYRTFHRFGQAKYPNGGSVLGSSQFSVLPLLPPKTMLGLKEVKIDLKKQLALLI